MNHKESTFSRDFDFAYKKVHAKGVRRATLGRGLIALTDKFGIMRTRTKCDLVQESYSELDNPDSVYTASTKVFLRLAEHLNAEHVLISLALVEGIESALKNLPPKLLITCSCLTVISYRYSFLKLLLPCVNRGCGLRINLFADDKEEAIDSAIFDSELVKAAPFLEICAECRISDGQLPYLKACWIFISFAPQISEEGLIRLIMQWLDGKRRINRLYIGCMLALTEDMVYKVRRCELIPESELNKTPFLKYFMEKHFESGFRVGVRNKAGNLILVNVSEGSCKIADPYSEDDPPLSQCSIDYRDDDHDD
ncbi:unnamed protein product [Cylicocyclus nassatus]|uniref:Uncharacterized protein n=1 Tax=Cylicocyclus nassatus TaxID=53992 RepID=A0AA36HGN6_CYLNA|nr:unnamed protein product [Cylicocyclus nassatus]